jgi:hypothetical protein
MNIQPNLTAKIQKSWLFNPIRIELKNPIQSKNPIKIQQKSNKSNFYRFLELDWLDVYSSVQSKIQKKS